MCFKPKASTATQQAVPTPEQTATPAAIGSTRKAEDQTLFGGTPDLNVTRPTVANGAATAGGSGLNLM